MQQVVYESTYDHISSVPYTLELRIMYVFYEVVQVLFNI